MWEREKQKEEQGKSTGFAGQKNLVKGTSILGTWKDHCSMWSGQLPDAASPQAWSTAGVLGLMAGWYVRKRLLCSLSPEGPVFAGLFAAFSRLVLAGKICCTKVVCGGSI